MLIDIVSRTSSSNNLCQTFRPLGSGHHQWQVHIHIHTAAYIHTYGKRIADGIRKKGRCKQSSGI